MSVSKTIPAGTTVLTTTPVIPPQGTTQQSELCVPVHPHEQKSNVVSDIQRILDGTTLPAASPTLFEDNDGNIYYIDYDKEVPPEVEAQRRRLDQIEKKKKKQSEQKTHRVHDLRNYADPNRKRGRSADAAIQLPIPKRPHLSAAQFYTKKVTKNAALIESELPPDGVDLDCNQYDGMSTYDEHNCTQVLRYSSTTLDNFLTRIRRDFPAVSERIQTKKLGKSRSSTKNSTKQVGNRMLIITPGGDAEWNKTNKIVENHDTCVFVHTPNGESDNDTTQKTQIKPYTYKGFLYYKGKRAWTRMPQGPIGNNMLVRIDYGGGRPVPNYSKRQVKHVWVTTWED
jgi:hypothetical protein